MGRPRKPVTDHIRDGSYRPERHGAQQHMPNLPAFGGEPPTELDDWGKRIWRETYSVIAGRGVLTEGDRSTFVAFCDSFGTFYHAMDEIRKTGLVREEVIPAAEGKPEKKKLVLSAWYDIKRNAFADGLRAASLLGLTPVDRARVVKAAGGTDDVKPVDTPKSRSALSNMGGPLKIRIQPEGE